MQDWQQDKLNNVLYMYVAVYKHQRQASCNMASHTDATGWTCVVDKYPLEDVLLQVYVAHSNGHHLHEDRTFSSLNISSIGVWLEIYMSIVLLQEIFFMVCVDTSVYYCCSNTVNLGQHLYYMAILNLWM